MGRKPFRIHDFEKKIGAYQQQGYFEVDVSLSQKSVLKMSSTPNQ